MVGLRELEVLEIYPFDLKNSEAEMSFYAATLPLNVKVIGVFAQKVDDDFSVLKKEALENKILIANNFVVSNGREFLIDKIIPITVER